MRRSKALVVLVGLLIVFSVSGVASAAELEGEQVLNVGHRGASGLAPEHTLASYDLALDFGADYIEQDLRMTSDGVLVVLHDEDLDRTTRGPAENCTGPVSEKTLDQIKTCDVGSFYTIRFFFLSASTDSSSCPARGSAILRPLRQPHLSPIQARPRPRRPPFLDFGDARERRHDEGLAGLHAIRPGRQEERDRAR